MNQAELDAAIIDLDGTMVDTMGDFVVALNLMLAGLSPGDSGKEGVDTDTVSRMVGKGSEHLVRSVLAHQQIEAEDYDAAYASYQKHYATVNGRHSAIYPGVVEGLEGLKRAGLKLACLTNKPAAFAVELLKLKGLDGFFSVVFGGDSFERKKPDPLPLLQTCRFLGTAPARTLMIGDSSNDALAARAAGCPVILVTYGYNHGQPVRAVNADGFIGSMAQLPLSAVLDKA